MSVGNQRSCLPLKGIWGAQRYQLLQAGNMGAAVGNQRACSFTDLSPSTVDVRWQSMELPSLEGYFGRSVTNQRYQILQAGNMGAAVSNQRARGFANLSPSTVNVRRQSTEKTVLNRTFYLSVLHWRN